MVESEPATEAATAIEVTFDDMTVLSEGGVDVFVLDWRGEHSPPYYVDVAGRRFAFTASTFLLEGHSALLADYVREQESEGRTMLLVERESRYYVYLDDPAAEAEDAAATDEPPADEPPADEADEGDEQ